MTHADPCARSPSPAHCLCRTSPPPKAPSCRERSATDLVQKAVQKVIGTRLLRPPWSVSIALLVLEFTFHRGVWRCHEPLPGIRGTVHLQASAGYDPSSWPLNSRVPGRLAYVPLWRTEVKERGPRAADDRRCWTQPVAPRAAGLLRLLLKWLSSPGVTGPQGDQGRRPHGCPR